MSFQMRRISYLPVIFTFLSNLELKNKTANKLRLNHNAGGSADPMHCDLAVSIF
jgi:hypothetical protein